MPNQTQRTIPMESQPIPARGQTQPKIVIHKPEYAVHKEREDLSMGSMANMPPVQEKEKQEVGFWSKLFGGGSKQPDTNPIQPSSRIAANLGVTPKLADIKRHSQVEPEELFIMNPSSKHMFGRRPGIGLSPRHGDELIALQTDDIQVLGSLQLPHKSRRSNLSEHQQNRDSQHPNDFGDEPPMTLNQLSRPTTSKQFLRKGGGEDDTPMTNDWNERLDEAVLDEDFDFIDKTINYSMQMEIPQSSGLAGLQRKKSEIPFVYNNQFKREFSKNVDELAKGSISRSFGRHMELVSSQPVIQVQKPISPSLLSPPVPSTAIRESSVSKEGSPVKSKFQFVTQSSDFSMEVPLELNNFTARVTEQRVIGESPVSNSPPEHDTFKRASSGLGVPVPIKYSLWRAA